MRDASIFESRGRAIRKVASLALIAVAAVALVAFASGANTKPTGAGKANLYNSDPFISCAQGGPAVGPEFGFVVLNTNKSGDLIVQVSVKNGAPNTTYDIYVNQDPGKCPTVPTATLTTNGQGNGNGTATEPRVPTATNFWISAVGGPHVLRSPAVVLD